MVRMQNVKGTFDYWGTEQALRQKVQRELEQLFTIYDFDSMETPMLNEQSLLASKYAGGDEILKEMYELSDQGDRRLALRYDLTIPFAKVVAMNPSLPLPFKRYEMGKVFRDGPVKRGRLREFVQCDADVVGIEGPQAEVELMQLAVDAFNRLGIDIVIRWNNRRFLQDLLLSVGVSLDLSLSVMLTLDKVAKIGVTGIESELLDKGLSSDLTNSVLELIQLDNANEELLIEKYELSNSVGAKEVRTLQMMLTETGLNNTCIFDPFLSRGLSFYTGTVYEIFDKTGAFGSSLGGGGRYDSIIGKLVDREDMNYPAIGLSFGIESILEILKLRQVNPSEQVVLVLPIGDDTLLAALQVASAFRKAGIRTRVDGSKRKLKKSLASAAAKGIRYVLLMGEEETKLGQVRLKDMLESTELVIPADQAVMIIEKQLK